MGTPWAIIDDGQRLVRSGGTCLQDIELRRQNEVYLDALGAQRIPDPTTAGDFCRRFAEADIDALQRVINETRVRVWRAQPAEFFDEAVIDADGTLTEMTGQCKEAPSGSPPSERRLPPRTPHSPSQKHPSAEHLD